MEDSFIADVPDIPEVIEAPELGGEDVPEQADLNDAADIIADVPQVDDVQGAADAPQEHPEKPQPPADDPNNITIHPKPGATIENPRVDNEPTIETQPIGIKKPPQPPEGWTPGGPEGRG